LVKFSPATLNSRAELTRIIETLVSSRANSMEKFRKFLGASKTLPPEELLKKILERSR